MRTKSWQAFEDYIAGCIKEIDPYARPTKGSGNGNESHDINTSCGLAIECKLRNIESININKSVWDKLCSEIPLHSQDIPMLALKNKNGCKWAILDLYDFLNLYIELWKLKNEK